jgi:hypothetical protein
MKRMLALLLCLLLCPAALAETFVVYYYTPEGSEDYALLLKDDGTVLTPPGTYSSIDVLTPEGAPEAERLYSVQAIGVDIDIDPDEIDYVDPSVYTREAVMDAEGNLLTGFDYIYIERESTGDYVFNAPEPAYDASELPGNPDLVDFHRLSDGRWLSLRMERPEDWDSMSPAERLRALSSSEFTEDADYRIVVVEPDGSVTDTGIINYNRSLPRYSFNTGAMDANFQLLIKPEYAALKPFGDGKWLGLRWDPTPPESLLTDDYLGMSMFEVLIVSPDGGVIETGLHTTSGYLPNITEGLCPVYYVAEYGDKTVYVDSEGAVQFEKRFDDADPFVDSYARVEVDDCYGLIDRNGDFAVEPRFDYMDLEDLGNRKLYIGRNNTTLTALDSDTCEVLWQADFSPADYVSWTVAGPGVLWINADDNYYYYDTDGQQIAAYVHPADGFISYTPCEADDPRVLEYHGEWPRDFTQLVGADGSVIGRPYQNMYDSYNEGSQVRYVTTVCRIIEDRDGEPQLDYNSFRYGIMDENGVELLPPIYEMASPLSLDRFWVSNGNRTGMIDSEGRWYYEINSYEYLMD